MSIDMLQFRQGLIEKRDAISAAIQALDAVIGTPALPADTAYPPRRKYVRRNSTGKKQRAAVKNGRTDGRTDGATTAPTRSAGASLTRHRTARRSSRSCGSMAV